MMIILFNNTVGHFIIKNQYQRFLATVQNKILYHHPAAVYGLTVRRRLVGFRVGRVTVLGRFPVVKRAYMMKFFSTNCTLLAADAGGYTAATSRLVESIADQASFEQRPRGCLLGLIAGLLGGLFSGSLAVLSATMATIEPGTVQGKLALTIRSHFFFAWS